jgi:hypothetical protein
MIDKDKKYATRDGREVRIYATDGKDFNSIHGAVLINDDWMVMNWNSDGRYVSSGATDADLVEVWQPQDKEPIWCWENHYKARRTLLFWDSVNDSTFNCNGGRNGSRYVNYAKVEHIEQWMLDVQAKLED